MLLTHRSTGFRSRSLLLLLLLLLQIVLSNRIPRARLLSVSSLLKGILGVSGSRTWSDVFFLRTHRLARRALAQPTELLRDIFQNAIVFPPGQWRRRVRKDRVRVVVNK